MQPSNSHLDPVRLAAFDEVPFTVDEQAHLAVCEACRAEVAAVMTVVALAAGVGRAKPAASAPRLVEFDAIAAGLRSTAPGDEPPVAVPLRATPKAPRRGIRVPPMLSSMLTPMMGRAAAALLLVSGGVLLGRTVGIPVRSTAEVAAGGGRVRSAALDNARDGIPFADRSYGSVDEATVALNRAQREYERASLWLASNDTTMRDPDVFRARLAALDQMMEASRVALRDAPQDPVLNHYYLAAYSAREATLQALGGVLPVDKIIERY